MVYQRRGRLRAFRLEQLLDGRAECRAQNSMMTPHVPIESRDFPPDSDPGRHCEHCEDSDYQRHTEFASHQHGSPCAGLRRRYRDRVGVEVSA